MHDKDEKPVLFRDIVALLKFDCGLVPAVGIACPAVDDKDYIYFAPHLSNNGYDWDLVVYWDYLGEVTTGYAVAPRSNIVKPEQRVCLTCAHFDYNGTEAGFCDDCKKVVPLLHTCGNHAFSEEYKPQKEPAK
jgi:hypothetical protein